MSAHSYSRCWIHLIWGTLNRDRVLNKKAAAGLSRYFIEYADEQAVYLKINFVNPDHVHALIDLPTGFSIEKMVQLLKGSSSPLGEFKRTGYRKICVGQRLWAVFCIAFQCGPGDAIHRRTGRTSSATHVWGRIARVHRSSRTSLARRTKPLKRLTTCSGGLAPA